MEGRVESVPSPFPSTNQPRQEKKTSPVKSPLSQPSLTRTHRAEQTPQHPGSIKNNSNTPDQRKNLLHSPDAVHITKQTKARETKRRNLPNPHNTNYYYCLVPSLEEEDNEEKTCPPSTTTAEQLMKKSTPPSCSSQPP
jgi:hypothetical protein